MYSLTDAWKACGSKPNKHPSQWLRTDGARSLMTAVKEKYGQCANMHNGSFTVVSSIRGGKDPGTWAHWQILMAYAKYLSPEFHMWANQVVKERMEEEVNPELGIHRNMERTERHVQKMKKLSETVGYVATVGHRNSVGHTT